MSVAAAVRKLLPRVFICEESISRKSLRLQGLEPVTDNYECSGDLSARDSPSSELSAGEQFETPAKEAVSFEFINPAYPDEDDMPILADPPVFYGESGRDDLEKYAHELDAWWFSCKSSSSTTSARLFEVLARRAFPYSPLLLSGLQSVRR